MTTKEEVKKIDKLNFEDWKTHGSEIVIGGKKENMFTQEFVKSLLDKVEKEARMDMFLIETDTPRRIDQLNQDRHLFMDELMLEVRKLLKQKDQEMIKEFESCIQNVTDGIHVVIVTQVNQVKWEELKSKYNN